MADRRIRVLVGYPIDESDIAAARAIGPDIDVTHVPFQLELDAIRSFATGTPEQCARMTPQFPKALLDALPETEVFYGLYLPVDVLERAPKLKWIANLGSGTDQYRVLGVLESDVVLTSSKGVAGRTIAEFVLSQILTLFKRTPERIVNQRAHKWRRVQHRDIHGRTLGIIGLGEIGSQLARMAKALGMRVLATKRNTGGAPPPNVDRLYESRDRVAMLSECDACAVMVALTDDTKGLIGRAEFAAMKKGAVFVDVSRGGVTDEAALVAALESGQLAGAALDVFMQEPLPATSRLWDTPNLLISPHNSVGLDDYGHAAFERFLENLARYLRGERLQGIVDPKLGY